MHIQRICITRVCMGHFIFTTLSARSSWEMAVRRPTDRSEAFTNDKHEASQDDVRNATSLMEGIIRSTDINQGEGARFLPHNGNFFPLPKVQPQRTHRAPSHIPWMIRFSDNGARDSAPPADCSRWWRTQCGRGRMLAVLSNSHTEKHKLTVGRKETLPSGA